MTLWQGRLPAENRRGPVLPPVGRRGSRGARDECRRYNHRQDAARSAVAVIAEGAGPPGARITKHSKERASVPWVLLAPCLLIIVLVMGYPLVRLVMLSFQSFGKSELWGFQDATWVGFENFAAILGDSTFWTVVVRTIVFAGGSVILTMVLGMLIALLMQRVSKAVKILISIALVASWGMPIIVATAIFKWIFDTDYGVLNWILSRLPGVDMVGHNWFASGPRASP